MDRFGFSAFTGSIVVASCGLLTVGILTYMHKYANVLSEKKVLTLISVLAIVGLLLSTVNIGIWGYFVILILFAGERILVPFMSEVVNYRTDENQRATVLSVASFLRTVPYVMLAPIIGYLSTQNKLEYFLIIWSFVIVLAIVMYLLLKKNDAKISLANDALELETRVSKADVE